jgi:UDP-2,3-diacylglucosamine pyrophosphatase LpxH
VGDIIDGWQLRRSWYWPQAHNDVVQKILRKARKGTRVIYVPGNHDEFARKYLDHSFGGVEVAHEWVHQRADGKRFWITHGDLFDGVIQHAKWLAYVGDWAYEFTLKLNAWLNRLRGRLGLPYWSLSRYLKLKVKRAVSFIGDYERAVAREARKREVDGVVCGHIHHAELREIDGLIYANDGDWVESLTALVEHPTAAWSCWTGRRWRGPTAPRRRAANRPRPTSRWRRCRCRWPPGASEPIRNPSAKGCPATGAGSPPAGVMVLSRNFHRLGA